jgi:hypothetical protein
MKKIIFVLVYLCIFSTSYAQNEGITAESAILRATIDTTGTIFPPLYNLSWKVKVPHHSIVFNMGYGFSALNNSLTKVESWQKKAGTGLLFGIDYRLQFPKQDGSGDFSIIGLAMGLGISYHKQSASLDNHSEHLQGFTDADGTLCDVTLDYQGIKESVSLTYLDIPLYLEIGKPSRVKISGYLDIGVKGSILLSGKFSGSGNYTSTGYYQNWDVSLHDVPELNYFTDKQSYENPSYKLSRFVLWGTLSGGVSFPFSSLEKDRFSSWILRIGGRIDYSLNKISKEVYEPYFKGSSYRINQSNLLGGTGSRILKLGLDVKLIYCL